MQYIKNKSKLSSNLYDERQLNLYWYDNVLEGKLYDVLPYEYHESGIYESKDCKPSVRNNLCKLVVEESISLLFSESHFPKINCNDEATRVLLENIIKYHHFNDLFLDCAFKGSIGSVAIFFGCYECDDGYSELFFIPLKTIFLTPVYKHRYSKILKSVIEMYETSGRALKKAEYSVEKEDIDEVFVFRKEYTENEIIFYTPKKKSDIKDEDIDELRNSKNWKIDKERSSAHKLGFVPIIWIKNLSGGDCVDGRCTFEGGVSNMIVKDYLLSQSAISMMYNAVPAQVYKSDSIIDAQPTDNSLTNIDVVLPATSRIGGLVKLAQAAGSAELARKKITIGADEDLALLEIKGNAAEASIHYNSMLREDTLEIIHGNRADTKKLSVAQSGKAMEMMNQSLVWLADRLRITYGEIGLIELLTMALKIIRNFPIKINGNLVKKDFKEDAVITLVWGDWFSYTPDDLAKQSMALSTLTNAQLLSKETAIKNLESNYEIGNVSDEINQIEVDQKEKISLASKISGTDVSSNSLTGQMPNSSIKYNSKPGQKPIIKR